MHIKVDIYAEHIHNCLICHVCPCLVLRTGFALFSLSYASCSHLFELNSLFYAKSHFFHICVIVICKGLINTDLYEIAMKEASHLRNLLYHIPLWFDPLFS